MQPAAAQRVRSPASIVGDGDHELVAAALDGHRDRGGLRVLGDVGQRLGHEEVARGLDVGRMAGLVELELDRQRGVRGQVLERGREAVVGEHGRVDPRRQITQLADRAPRLLGRGVERRRRRHAARLLDPHERSDQPLLGAVVEVAADPAPLGRGGARQPRARARQLLRAGLLGGGARACRLGLQPLGDVAEDDDGAGPLVGLKRRRGVGHRHHRAVAADEPVLLDAHRAPARARLQQRALLGRERRAVGSRVVDRGVAVAAQQLVGAVVAEHGQRRPG